MSKRPEENLWYVHAPLKNEKRPVVEAPPPSNIPYLNGIMDNEEEINKKQVIIFRETDSDFVKLSKMGGREDLLIHKTKQRPKGPVGYPIATWWTDMMQYSEQPKTEKHVFEVPAWFAHQTKVNIEELNENNPINFPYAVDKNRSFFNANKFEAIEEPKKYGELRNYLNPIKIRSNNVNVKPTEVKHSEIKKPSSATTMPKLIGNFYQKDRPSNYAEWKSQNELSNKRQPIGVSSSKLHK